MSTPEQVMKQCQIGTQNFNAANDLHADCYGTIGKLLNEKELLSKQAHDQKELLTLIHNDLLMRSDDGVIDISDFIWRRIEKALA